MARVCIATRKPLGFNYRVQRQVKALCSAGHVVTLLALEAPTSLRESEKIEIVIIDAQGLASDALVYIRNQGALRKRLLKSVLRGYGTTAKLMDQLSGKEGAYGSDFRGTLRRLEAQYRAPTVSRSYTDDIPDRLYWRDFDVVQVHDTYAIDAGIKIAEETGARLVADAVELATERTATGPAPESKLASLVNERWAKQRYSKFDASIAVGDGVASWTAKELQIKKPTVVRNCRPASFREIDPPFDIRDEVDVPNDAYLCVFTGSIRETTSVDSLLLALPRVDTEFHVSLLGPGHDSDYASHLRETASDLGIRHKLHFVDPVNADEVPATIMSADFGFHGLDDSSLNNIYALPNKFFEYVTAQIPLAVPDYPDMGGLTKEYKMGVTFEEAKPEAIAISLEELFQNYDHYQRNVISASEELTWANEAEKYIAVMQEQAAKSSEKRTAFQWIDGDRESVESPELQ